MCSSSTTIKTALSSMILQHGRSLINLQKSFGVDFNIPDVFGVPNNADFFSNQLNELNYSFHWHRQSQQNYALRIEFFREALCDYERFTGETHFADVYYPQLSEIPDALKMSGHISNNRPLVVNNPCNVPYLTLLGASSMNNELSFESVKSITSAGFRLI